MNPTDGQREGTSVKHVARIFRRRKLPFILALLLVPTPAIFFSLREPAAYSATADVILSRVNLAATLTGTSDPNVLLQPGQIALTEANVARVPLIAKRTIAATGLKDETPQQFLKDSSVTPVRSTDLLQFSFVAHDPEQAQRVATQYAIQYKRFRHELDTAGIRTADSQLTERLKHVNKKNDKQLYTALLTRSLQLQTLGALAASNSYVVRGADHATKVRPRPVLSGILGLLGGIVVGCALVFLAEAIDSRVRSSDEIGEILRIPLLARLAPPSRRLQKQRELVMLREPSSNGAESFRLLGTNFEFVSIDRQPRTVMVTSAFPEEGKSTTIANLAVALARGGKRIVLIDLDLRRPTISRFFGLSNAAGLTNAALNGDLLGALHPIDLPSSVGDRMTDVRDRVAAGSLHVVPSGPLPPDPGDFVKSATLARILDELQEEADLVLIDAPPLLNVSDSVSLLSQVDAVILLARLRLVTRQALNEVRHILTISNAHAFGFVATGGSADELYSYAGADYYRARVDAEAARESALA